ncbi:TPA: purine-nucleoside phosphorylase [Streptococcus suis]
MSIHISAKPGEIADKILLPGDPLRAKFIAENFLEDAVCFNEVRNMFGYTGTYKGHRVSVLGTGMGMPSISIYAHELITEYGVKKLIRVGTAGSLNKDVHVRELVLAQGAATNSKMMNIDWPEYDLPQIADFELLDKAYHIAKELNLTIHVGNVLSSDSFYSPKLFSRNLELGKLGVKAVEMEAAALYYLGAKFGVQTLAIMTISDSLVNPEEDTTAEERQNTFTDMMKVGLETLIADE